MSATMRNIQELLSEACDVNSLERHYIYPLIYFTSWFQLMVPWVKALCSPMVGIMKHSCSLAHISSNLKFSAFWVLMEHRHSNQGFLLKRCYRMIFYLLGCFLPWRLLEIVHFPSFFLHEVFYTPVWIWYVNFHGRGFARSIL